NGLLREPGERAIEEEGGKNEDRGSEEQRGEDDPEHCGPAPAAALVAQPFQRADSEPEPERADRRGHQRGDGEGVDGLLLQGREGGGAGGRASGAVRRGGRSSGGGGRGRRGGG